MLVFQKLKTAKVAGVYTVTLAYPERRNAIGPLMTNELLHALSEAENDADVRVVVITGEGKAFCAGGDFGAMTGGGDQPALAHKGDYADLLLTLCRFEKPVIAKVNGAAMGGGLGIVAASTFAIASAEAQFGTPEVNVGLFPMMIMAVLARLVPKRQLLSMMLLGDKVEANAAKELGLVGSVVPAEGLDDAVASLAAKLSAKSPLTLRLGLRAYAAQADLDLAQALPMLREKLGECLATEDAREGLMAFLEKRAPNWTGK